MSVALTHAVDARQPKKNYLATRFLPALPRMDPSPPADFPPLISKSPPDLDLTSEFGWPSPGGRVGGQPIPRHAHRTSIRGHSNTIFQNIPQPMSHVMSLRPNDGVARAKEHKD